MTWYILNKTQIHQINCHNNPNSTKGTSAYYFLYLQDKRNALFHSMHTEMRLFLQIPIWLSTIQETFEILTYLNLLTDGNRMYVYVYIS